MDAILNLPIMETLGWTVLHSFWQGALIGMIVYLLAKFSPKNSALQYNLSVFGVFAIFITSIITFVSLSYQYAVIIEPISSFEGTFADFSASENTQTSAGLNTLLFKNIRIVSIIYLLGLSFFSCKFIISVYKSAQLQFSDKTFLPIKWVSKMNSLQIQMGISKRIDLFESSKISSPLVIGFLKPMILFPIGLINKLSPEETEAILVHELSHIKRNDYLINLFLSGIHMVFHYHPVVWWLVSKAKTEREHCCDIIAIESLNNNPIQYAKTLIRLQQFTINSKDLSVAFAGHDSSFSARMKRILNQPNKTSIMEKLSTSLVLVLIVAGLSLALIEKQSPETGNELFLENTFQSLDTVPKKVSKIVEEVNGKTTEATLEDGKVTELIIDGVKVPEEELGSHPDALRILKEEKTVKRDRNSSREKRIEYEIKRKKLDEHRRDIRRDVNEEREIIREERRIHPRRGHRIMERIVDGDTIIIKREDGEDEGEIIIDGLGNSIKIEINGEEILLNGESFEPGSIEIIVDEDQIFGPKGLRLHMDKLHERLLPLHEKFLHNFEWKGGDMDEEQIEKLKEQFKNLEFDFDFQNNFKLLEDSLGNFNFDFDFDIKGMEDLEKRLHRAPNFRFRGNPRIDIHRENHFERKEESIQSRIESELIRDGLIEGRSNYSFDMNGSRLKVNNKRMSREFYDKYKFLYQKWTDKPFSGEVEYLERKPEKL
jgi:beta-lactamase regulating signal transducer with metallopeptidase domain